jgi:hypothetical protein
MSNRRPAIGQKIIENEAAYAAAVKRNIVQRPKITAVIVEHHTCG